MSRAMWTSLGGSEREWVGSVDSVPLTGREELVEATVCLRPAELLEAVVKQFKIGPRTAGFKREELIRRTSARRGDVRRVVAHAEAFGLHVDRIDTAAARVFVSGYAGDAARAFGVMLSRGTVNGRSVRFAEGPAHLPADIAEVVTAVLGLGDGPVATPCCELALPSDIVETPGDLARRFGYPGATGAAGQCIAIVALNRPRMSDGMTGGGFSPGDIAAYCADPRVRVPMPDVRVVRVSGGDNRPGLDSVGDRVLTMQIEVIAAMAPGARIVVYMAPDSERGLCDALRAAVTDAEYAPSAVCLGWAGEEASWSPAGRADMDATLRLAAALRITVCAAMDSAHAFPAGSPFALACACTTCADIRGIGPTKPAPAWQEYGIGAFPDVAGGPAEGVLCRVEGEDAVVTGAASSAAAWTALTAALNARLGCRIGHLNPRLYRSLGPGSWFRRKAGLWSGAGRTRWSPVTGWGVPCGPHLERALEKPCRVARSRRAATCPPPACGVDAWAEDSVEMIDELA